MSVTTGRPTRAVTVGDHEFRVDGDKVALYGGAVHYWRLDRDVWSPILDSVKALGFTTISIYIPWEAHELERGVFDFGEVNPSNDIDAFLTLCEEKGLRIVVRPGPQINSELTWFGYPKRILANERLHALSGRGSKAILTQVPKPIPALSYAEDEFFSETALWYDAICAILAKHAYPNGGIVAAQVDNEMAYFFHINAYACDYSPASVRGYQRFLLDKYGSLEAINSAYGTSHASAQEIDPPRRYAATAMADIPFHVDWVAYREAYLVTSMDRLGTMMRERGLGQIALFHNYPHPLGPGGAVSGFTTPFNLVALEEKLDFVGFDIYSRKELYDHVKTVASYVVGTSRFPYIPEFIAGVWPWYLHPGGGADEEFVTKAALMHGIKGFSRYMLVERDRWLDSPIRRDGRLREEKCAVHARANEVAGLAGLAELRREAPVLLLANREYDRLEAASVLVSFPGDFLETPSGFSEYANPMTISEDALGMASPIQLDKSSWFSACYTGLTAAGVGFLISDTALPRERWDTHEVVVVSTFEYLDKGLQEDLVSFASAGGTVVIGPRVPSRDSLMRPDRTLVAALAGDPTPVRCDGTDVGQQYLVGAGQIALISDMTDARAVFDALLVGLPKVSTSDPRLDVVVHAAPDRADRKVVFVANPTAEATSARVDVGVPLRDAAELWSDRRVAVEGTEIVDDLPAYSIHIYACTLA